jgi:hypothetical protein
MQISDLPLERVNIAEHKVLKVGIPRQFHAKRRKNFRVGGASNRRAATFLPHAQVPQHPTHPPSPIKISSS